jgi:hypothetical protein
MFRIKKPGVFDEAAPGAVRPLRFKIVKYRNSQESASKEGTMTYTVRAALIPWRRQAAPRGGGGAVYSSSAAAAAAASRCGRAAAVLPVVQCVSQRARPTGEGAGGGDASNGAAPLNGTEAKWTLQEFNVPGADCFADIFFYLIATPSRGGGASGGDARIVGSAWLPSWAVFRQSVPSHRQCAGLQRHSALHRYLVATYGADPNTHASVQALFDASITDPSQVFRTFQLRLEAPPDAALWRDELLDEVHLEHARRSAREDAEVEAHPLVPIFCDETMPSRVASCDVDAERGALSIEFDACGPTEQTWCGAVNVFGINGSSNNPRWCVLAGPCLYLYKEMVGSTAAEGGGGGGGDGDWSSAALALNSPFTQAPAKVKYEPVNRVREIIDLKSAVVSELLSGKGRIPIQLADAELGLFGLARGQPLMIGLHDAGEGGNGAVGGGGEPRARQGRLDDLHSRLHFASDKARKQRGLTHMGRFEGFGLDDMQPHVEEETPLPFCERCVVTYYSEWEPIAEGGASSSCCFSLPSSKVLAPRPHCRLDCPPPIVLPRHSVDIRRFPDP